eukprot:512839-Amphidinium_carterae.1
MLHQRKQFRPPIPFKTKEKFKFQGHRYTPEYWRNEQNGVFQWVYSFISSKTFERYWYAEFSSLLHCIFGSDSTAAVLLLARNMSLGYKLLEAEGGYNGAPLHESCAVSTMLSELVL